MRLFRELRLMVCSIIQRLGDGKMAPELGDGGGLWQVQISGDLRQLKNMLEICVNIRFYGPKSSGGI